MYQKTFIIAEIGINFEGDINLAKKLIIDAKKAGADAVKFQVFERETLGRDKNFKPSKFWGKLYLDDRKLSTLKEFTKKIKIEFICSVFDEISLKRVINLKPKYIKIASSELNNLRLMRLIKKQKVKIILSTGMSSNNEILKAIKILKNPILLHCVSVYPCELKNINLKRMLKLLKYKLITGFSDHTIGIEASKVAISLGAKVIEKHFTYNTKAKGYDHIFSSNKKEMAELVNFSKNYYKMLGNGKIAPRREELKIQKLARKGIYFSKCLKKNHVLSLNDLAFLRPQNGLDINNLGVFLGKKLNRNVYKYQSLNKKYFN